MKRPLKVVIVGTGFLARTRARCWRRVYGHGIELAVASRERGRAEAFAREHDLAGAHSIDEALGSPSITLVDLCVANRAHRELTERAAAAGVLCTKPLAAFWGRDSARSRARKRCSRPAARRCSRVRSKTPKRCSPPVHTLECSSSTVRTGSSRQRFGARRSSAQPRAGRSASCAAGRAIRARIRLFPRLAPHRCCFSSGHPVGAMLWLLRREGLRQRGEARAVSVMAELSGSANELESAGTCAIRFDDGTLGLAHGSDHMLGGMQSHLTVLANDHRFECALSPIDTLRAYAPRDGTFGNEPIMEKISGQSGWTTPIPDEDWSSGQQGMLQAVADSLASGAAPEADGALGLETVRVLYAAYASAAEGRRIPLR
jgi:predicted dehydrogenase